MRGVPTLRSMLVLVFTAAPLTAQEPVVGVEVDAVVNGTLYVAGAPADSGTVHLHRVSPEQASSLDSITVGPDGSFSLDLPNLPVPGSGEVFFVSTRYDGIVYPGEMLTDPVQLDAEYRVEAYGTRRVPAQGAAFGVSRRETWITEGPLGWQVMDVLEIVNPDTMTVVPEPGGAVWRYPLPPAAVGPRVVQVGPVQGPATFEGNTLVASNPVVPAANFYVVQYDLETIEFDLPMPGRTGQAQLLLEQPAPEVRVTGLARSDPGPIEFGSDFAYWLGQDLLDQTIEVRIGAQSAPSPAVWLWLSVALALAIVGAGTLVTSRRRSTTGRRLRRDVLVDLARLDEEYAAGEVEDPAGRARYADRRAELIRELAELESHHRTGA